MLPDIPNDLLQLTKSTNYNYVEYRLETYDIKENTLYQQQLKEIHTLALKVIFQDKNDTARRRQKNLKKYLSELPLQLRNSLCSDIFPRCLMCQDLLFQAEIDFCIHPKDNLSRYIFLLSSGLSLSGQCFLRVKEHFDYIVFD